MAIAELLRPPILAASRSPRIERAVTRMPLTRQTVDRFVAGTTEHDVVEVAGRIRQAGRYVVIDYLAEDTTDMSQVTDTTAHYLTLIELLERRADRPDAGLPHQVEVSVRLSGLGQFLPRDGHQIALDNAQQICTAAERAGVWVTVDAEDHTTTDSTLSIVQELRADFPDLGTVLQAYLTRTEADCRDLSGPRSRIRLCKGAYKEPASVAYQSKDQIDAAYGRCLRILMEGQGYPMVASHDPAMIQIALEQALAVGRGTDRFELQMLYGVRDTEQQRIVDNQVHLRTFLAYGQQWYGYLMRRLAERPQNLALFLKSLTSTK